MTVPPFDTLKEAAADLRRPFEPLAVRWKAQSTWPKGSDEQPKGALVVCYIDRGLAVDRLNVLVPHLWSATFEERERNHMLCRLTIDGITREDVGEGGTPKARHSDALKRAAVHFGVGVSLSRVPQSRLEVAKGGLRVFGGPGKWGVDLTQDGLDYLRERYAKWLVDTGAEVYGAPLQHGDLGDAQGDDEITDIVLERDATDLYVALSQVGLTLRQQVGLLNTAGAAIQPTATAHEIAAAVGGLTEEQAQHLDRLIAQTMGGSDGHR